MLEFTQPWVFALLLAPLLVRWLSPPHRESRDSLQVPYFERLVELSGEKPAAGASVLRRRAIQGVTVTLGWILLVLALARPEWVGDPVTLNKSARDLMIALDLSGSMAATDFRDADGAATDRLSAAKRVLQDFIAAREGDRVGLIVFGNAAYLQAPFTDDRDTWLTLLEESEVAMAGPSTALGDAIGLALALFQQSETENRVLIVLTDGNDTGSRVPPIDAATVAAAQDVTVYTVAVGDPTTVGEEALDTDTLDTVAERTGGQSFIAIDRAGLREAYARIDALEPALYDALSFRPRTAVFHLPLSAFAVLYLLALPLFIVLARTRRETSDA